MWEKRSDVRSAPRNASSTQGRQSAQQFLPCPVAADARGWEHRRRRTSTSFSPSRTRSRRARFLALGLRFNSMLSSVYTTLAGALLNVSKHAGVNVSRATTTIVSIPQPLADGHLAAGMNFGGMQRLGDVSLDCAPLDSSKLVRANASLAPGSSGSSLRPPTDGDLAAGADFYSMELFANATRARAQGNDNSSPCSWLQAVADEDIDASKNLPGTQTWPPPCWTRRGTWNPPPRSLLLALPKARSRSWRGTLPLARTTMTCSSPQTRPWRARSWTR